MTKLVVAAEDPENPSLATSYAVHFGPLLLPTSSRGREQRSTSDRGRDLKAGTGGHMLPRGVVRPRPPVRQTSTALILWLGGPLPQPLQRLGSSSRNWFPSPALSRAPSLADTCYTASVLRAVKEGARGPPNLTYLTYLVVVVEATS